MKIILASLLFLLVQNGFCQSACPATYQNSAIRANILLSQTGHSSSSGCCSLCTQNSACLAYKWNTTNGGTCYLLDDNQPLYASNGEVVGVAPPTSSNTYSILTSYDSTNWLNDGLWDFKTGTGDFTIYTDKNTAISKRLVKTENGKVYLGMDNTTILDWNDDTIKGRNGTRIETVAKYNAGLFILNLDHMPTGPGVMAEFWAYGPNYPNEGEIDILQGPANKDYNTITLHTNEGCEMQVSDDRFFTGTWELQNNKPGANCWNEAPGQYEYTGCGIQAPNNTLNVGFNELGGGVFALEWDHEKFIRVWNFLQPNVPADINSANPNPATWGMPTAYFTIGSNCTSNHFQAQTLVLMADLCPSWGYYPGGSCSCKNSALFNPEGYSEAYWGINYLKVFCKPGQQCTA